MSQTILMTVIGAITVWVIAVVLYALVSAKNPATDALEAEPPSHHHDHDEDHAAAHSQTGGHSPAHH